METLEKEKTSVKKAVLVIDDDEDMRELIADALREEGFDVLAAGNGFAGVAAAEERKPDLVLLDVMLPDMDGVSVIEKLKKAGGAGDIPVIMVTARHDLQTKLMSYVSGARRYITKPFGVDELVYEVRKTLEQAESSRRIKRYRECTGETGDFGVFDPRQFDLNDCPV
jgi:DNA-binding response OmpR family regulator